MATAIIQKSERLVYTLPALTEKSKGAYITVIIPFSPQELLNAKGGKKAHIQRVKKSNLTRFENDRATVIKEFMRELRTRDAN